jgi:hypothetical protein
MIGTVSNGEQLLEVRNKLNETINQVNDIGTVSSSVQGQLDTISNNINTVTEFIYMSFKMDTSNNVYLPINGINESVDIDDPGVSLLAPFSGQIISASVKTDVDMGFSIFYFHKNLNTTPTNNIGYGSLTGGSTNKTEFTGTIADRSFSQGDLIHFRYFSPVETPSNQILHFTIELVYFK